MCVIFEPNSEEYHAHPYFVTSFLNGGICAPDVVAVCVKNRHRMISSSSAGEIDLAISLHHVCEEMTAQHDFSNASWVQKQKENQKWNDEVQKELEWYAVLLIDCRSLHRSCT